MSAVDIAYLRQWIGKEQIDFDHLSLRHARLMAATLGWSPQGLADGTPLPPLWHWIYFLKGLPREQLGRDGHPARGGFLPPVPLSNRMWAGGSLEFHAPVPLGANIERRSRVLSVEHKHGHSGELVFVAVLHELLHSGKLVISEVHDLVYKDQTPPGDPVRSSQAMPVARHTESFRPDSTTLFRYSALTFNGHRIHYDADYCRDVEGYANLVVHGPLNATVLAAFAEKIGGRQLKAFRYRAVRPSLLGSPLSVNAVEDGAGMLLWVSLPDGSVSMRAQAHFSDVS